MRGRALSFWAAAFAVAYVGFAALRATRGGVFAWAALAGLPIAVAFGWRLTAPPLRSPDGAETSARTAARACIAGAAIALAARTGTDAMSFRAMTNVGAAMATLGALVALARLAGFGGLAPPATAARRLDAIPFAALLWTVAIALPLAYAASPARAEQLDPVTIDYATSAASLGALGILVAAASRVRAVRRVELGVADRATTALYLALTGLCIGLGASLVEVAAPERVLPISAAGAALGVAWAAVAPDANRLSRALRTVLAVASLAAPIALGAVFVAHRTPRHAPLIAFLAAAAAALAGLLAPYLARFFAPEPLRWLEGFEAASLAAMDPDPEAALEAALVTLGRCAGAASASPALYRLLPPEVVTVDRGGYVHTQKASVPDALIDLADHEPDRILRTEVLRALEIRRPDVRPLVAWLDERGVAATAVVRDAAEPIALLAIPARDAKTLATLEEVRALRALANRMGAVIGVSAMLARSRDRELAERARADEKAAETRRISETFEHHVKRMNAFVHVLERPARVASYGPLARTTVEELERIAGSGRPVALLAPPGVDAVAWAALVHLASPRKDGLFSVVDGTSSAEHHLFRWRDPRESPVFLASGGTLVLLDPQALPEAVQTYVAAALPEDAGVVVSVPKTIDSLVASGRLDERLADRLGDRAVALPTLAGRGEDLRPLALHHLARIGAQLRSAPLGLDLRALAVLGEHDWPCNDAELVSVLTRAALVCEGDVVGTRELDAIGFTPIRTSADPFAIAMSIGSGTPRRAPATPLPSAGRRKRRRA